MFCLQLAAEYKLVPLTTQKIKSSFSKVVQEHLTARRAGITPQAQRIVDDLRTLIRDQPSKFPELSIEAMATDKRLGYRKRFKDQECYLFQSETLVKHIGGESVGLRDLLHALKSANLLRVKEKDKEKRGTLVVKMPDGTTARVVAVRAAILSDD
jgi:hypothetical protein